LWSTGETTEKIENLLASSYNVEILDANNCSIIENIIVDAPAPVNGILNYTICSGDSIEINGRFIYASGTYNDTLIAANGCDSVAISIVAEIDRVNVIDSIYGLNRLTQPSLMLIL
jgi:hypothetical protein